VLGLSSRQRGKAVPSFTIGLDKAGPDERTQSAESAAALGSPLSTVTIGRSDIAAAYPELIRAAEGPVLDTSCAALMRLAGAVHDQGFKVALTGEGADEALAGYIWFKGQKIRDVLKRSWFGGLLTMAIRGGLMAGVGGRSAPGLSRTPIKGVRTAQQDTYDVLGRARSHVYAAGMWDELAGGSAYDDLAMTNDRIGRWAPLNQSLYVGYKLMLPGLLLQAKGDRVAMNASVEARYPFLDDDVIAFCAGLAPEYKLHGLTEKWLLRRVAARTLPPQIANRPKTMFRASRSETFLGNDRPHWVDQLLSPDSLRATGYFDPGAIARERALQVRIPRITLKRLVLDLSLTSVVATQLWHHTFCGGGLCDLPTWSPPRLHLPDAALDTVAQTYGQSLSASLG
jgi:asparagine synthase (glutamine-hydrolysing)